ncbi:response regulator [Saccharicrinis aurantiacus]|uniref:response regulator n=1 Tax=Saccharicrinis aurantiacus TaxID=1849719 RepID=UPI0024917899|nr:response regulator [Saccharicrinis aurantiacus]
MNNSIGILYVDDEPINLQLFKINLGNKYNIFTANSGSNALEVLAQFKKQINVIVSDFRMPKMNGIELINTAKLKYPSINCYMLTGFDTNKEIDEAIDKGTLNKCFRKPFNMVEIDYEMKAIGGSV